MLNSLHIKNYILIDSLDISFPESLVIITGQTGAGKSILLGALSLLSGAKADASLISEGADSCVVEAEFDYDDESVDAVLAEAEAESDGRHLILRRVVSASGRSRCFVNDCPVQVSVLQAISERLVDIHSQHKSLMLTDKAFQLSILDAFSGNGELRARCRESWSSCQKLREKLGRLEERLRNFNAESDYNSAQLSELRAAALREGELEELETEQKSLANASQIKESLSLAISIFDSGEEGSGVSQALRDIRRELDHTGKFLPQLESLSERVESSRIELEDIYDELCSLDSGIDLSPEHLGQVEDRLSVLYSLLKKHSCRTVGELIALRDSLGESFASSEELEDEIASVRKQADAEYSRYCAVADELSAVRHARSGEFASAILDSLHFLELDRSAFEVGLESAPEGPCGHDKVQFLFSATGTAPVDVAKCASGGEISRIMLSLKAMMARFVGMPTLIFDEIDTGVSGSVADKMGRMVCDMGRDMQVFSITHLPQVAAKGDAHYVVSKEIDAAGRAVSSIRKVEGRERVMEIARLLSGASVTQAAVANAESLLQGR